MSPLLKTLAASASVVIIGMGMLTLSTQAGAHPHEKTVQEKATPKKIFKEKIIIETAPDDDHAKDDILTDDDLKAHFEQHEKALRDSLSKAKIKTRIIRRSLDRESSDDADITVEKSITSHSAGTKRIKIIKDPDQIRETAKSLQNLLSDSGILEEFADIVIGLAEDIEIESGDNGMRLSFDGKRIGGIAIDQDKNSLSIDSLGGNTTIEKEVFIENGKKKTRIIIETDSDETDFDIVPGRKRKSEF